MQKAVWNHSKQSTASSRRGSITMKSVFTSLLCSSSHRPACKLNSHCANFVRRIRFFGFGILAHLPHRRAKPLSLLDALTVIAYAPDPSNTHSGTSLAHAMPCSACWPSPKLTLRAARCQQLFTPFHLFPLRKRTASAWPCCTRWTCLPTVTTSPGNFTVHVCKLLVTASC